MIKTENKIYCIGMDAIKNYGINMWEKEFFMPFSIKSYEIFSIQFYNMYKEILSSGLSDITKDIVCIRVDLMRKYAHFLHSYMLTKYLASKGYKVIYSGGKPYSKFSREKIYNLLNDDFYTYFKRTSFHFISKAYGLFGFRKCLNVGPPTDRLKSIYAKKKRLYLQFKPYNKLISLKDSIPTTLLTELRYVVSRFNDTRRRILNYYGLYDKGIDEINTMLLEDLSLTTRLYLGTKERLKLLDYDHILATSLGNIVNRTIFKILLTERKRITGFNHGNTLGLIYDKIFLLSELLLVTNYVVQTGAIKSFFDNLVRINSDFPLPQKPITESVEDNYFPRMYHREKKKSMPKKSKKVMVLQSSFNDIFTLYSTPLYYSIQLDLNLRIMKALKKYGYYVMIKLRVDRLEEIDGGKIFEGFADECVKGTFEKEYQKADTIIFPHVLTTTFGFALASNKKIIYFLYEKEKFIPEMLGLLNKRCIPINCWSDDRNRIIFNEDELIDALEKDHTEINTEFIERQLFPQPY
ncbi:MAG: hypothetical protein ISS34_00180 [Candidatus Omnitrophica bacterium]|nr:hypothetical protein [Candidatus Omnitrophota bacterium]